MAQGKGGKDEQGWGRAVDSKSSENDNNGESKNIEKSKDAVESNKSGEEGVDKQKQLLLSEMHGLLQQYDLTNGTSYSNATGMVADWDGEKHIVFQDSIRRFSKSQTLTNEGMQETLGKLQSLVFLTFKFQDGRQREYHFSVQKKWKALKAQLAREIGETDLTGSQFLCDEKYVTAMGPKWKAGKRYEVDVMAKQTGG